MSGHTEYAAHEIKGYLVSVGKRASITTLATGHIASRSNRIVVALIFHQGLHIADVLRLGGRQRHATFMIEPTPHGLNLDISELEDVVSASITTAAAKVLRHLDEWNIISKRERREVLKNLAEFCEEQEQWMHMQMTSSPYMSNEFYNLTFSTDVAELLSRHLTERERKALWKMTREELVTFLLIALEAFGE